MINPRSALFTVLLLLLSGCVSAGPQSVTYTINNSRVPLVRYTSSGITVTSSCGQNPDCDAYTALGRASLAGIDQNPEFPAGVMICREQFDGDVVYAVDDTGAAAQFCVFDGAGGDGSMVDCGALETYARMNDERAAGGR